MNKVEINQQIDTQEDFERQFKGIILEVGEAQVRKGLEKMGYGEKGAQKQIKFNIAIHSKKVSESQGNGKSFEVRLRDARDLEIDNDVQEMITQKEGVMIEENKEYKIYEFNSNIK